MDLNQKVGAVGTLQGLNRDDSSMKGNFSNPKSKYKVYKFSVVEKTKKKRKSRKKEQDENQPVVGGPTLQSDASNVVAVESPKPSSFTPTREFIYYLDEKLLLKSFRTDVYSYYTQYIA